MNTVPRLPRLGKRTPLVAARDYLRSFFARNGFDAVLIERDRVKHHRAV